MQPETTDSDKNLFASMQPHRVPHGTPSSSDIQMIRAYKKAHAWNVSEAPNDWEMIYSKTICRKCLLHRKVCRTFGHNLRKYEAELQIAKVMNKEIGHNMKPGK